MLQKGRVSTANEGGGARRLTGTSVSGEDPRYVLRVLLHEDGRTQESLGDGYKDTSDRELRLPHMM